jgi:hypothetical protein
MTTVPQSEKRTSGTAIAALVLGICGIVVFPLIGVVGLFVGYRARDEIARNPELGGEGLATAGIILGWVSIVLVAIGLLVLIALLAAV